MFLKSIPPMCLGFVAEFQVNRCNGMPANTALKINRENDFSGLLVALEVITFH